MGKNKVSPDEWEHATKENTSTIERKISYLEATTGPFSDLAEMFIPRHDYKEFWNHVKEINELFKTLKPLKPEDREQLWNRLNSVCEAVKNKQRQDRESGERSSKAEKEIILDLIRKANNWGYGAKETEDTHQGQSCLQQAIDRMKGNRTLSKQDHEECYQAWEEAKDALNAGRERVFENNWIHVHDDIKTILHNAKYGNPYDAHNDIKEFQSTTMRSTSLAPGKFQEAHDLLELAWETASERIAEQKQERQRKSDDWRTRQEGHIERWRANIEKAEGVISNLRDQIRDCERMQSDASTSEFADTVQGWIDEKEGKIHDIEASIGELEEKIRDVEHKLRD